MRPLKFNGPCCVHVPSITRCLVLGIVKTRLTLCRIGILWIPSGIWKTPFPFLPKVGRQFSLRRRDLFGLVVRQGHDFVLRKSPPKNTNPASQIQRECMTRR